MTDTHTVVIRRVEAPDGGLQDFATPHPTSKGIYEFKTPTPDFGDHRHAVTHRKNVADAGAAKPRRTIRRAIDGMLPIQELPCADGRGQRLGDTQRKTASAVTLICDELREQHRQRQDLHRAEKSLTLQIRAKCRRLVDGDKKVADILYDAMSGKGEHDLAAIALAASMPFIDARKMIEASRKQVEKRMAKIAGQLPVAAWVKETRGLGIAGVAAVIGECGDLSNYANPAKVWKRMGLAVMPDGTRQRMISGAAAIEHGYSPSRRSIAWNIGACLIKAGGPYKELYDERKAHEVARNPEITKIWAHNRAKRYIEKRLLRNLWRAWRKTESAAPCIM